MIHILFGASAAGSLKFAFKNMGLNKKETVISLGDIFSIGPVWKLTEEIGMKSRFEWMGKCMSDELDEYSDYKQDFKTAIHQVHSISEGDNVTIWASDNAHEQTGLRFVLHLLKGKMLAVNVINATEEYKKLFQAGNVKIELLHTGEIPPEKLRYIYKHGNDELLTHHDRESFDKEWLSLTNTRNTLRIWRNKRIQSVPEDYFDDFIIKRAQLVESERKGKEFVKAARIIGEVVGHLDQYIGDTFLDYRIRELISSGIFASKGKLEAVRFYSVRLNQ